MKNRWLALALLAAAIAAPQTGAAQETVVQDAGDVTYSVVAGDNLFDLADRYFVNARAARRVQVRNRIRNPRRIPVGTRLTIARELLRWEPVQLRIASFSGPVTVTGPEGAVAPQKSLALGEGWELATGNNGFVSLGGSDGSRFALPSHSTVRVNLARRYLINQAATIDLEVRKGRADVTAPKQKPDGRFRLRTPASVTAVRGTEFRVAYDTGRSSGFTEVLEGLVDVRTPANSIDVPAGFGAAAAADGGLAREELLPAPGADNPGRVQTEETVTFALKPVATASAYRVQVARDASFLDVIAEDVEAEPRAELADIANGRLFMRASAIAPSGIEGKSEVWSFRRQRVDLKAEAGQAGIPDGFRINWLAEGEGTSIYRLQLFRSDNPAVPLVDEAGMTDTGITMTGLGRGTFLWRVGVIQTTPDGAAEVWTPVQKFTVAD